MSFLLWLCIILFIFICMLLILIVLIQKGRGGGLASAFGGAGGNTAFGSKTGDVLTWVTSVIFGIFILLAVSLNLLADYTSHRAIGASNTRDNAATTGEQTGGRTTDQSAGATTVPATPESSSTKPAR